MPPGSRGASAPQNRADGGAHELGVDGAVVAPTARAVIACIARGGRSGDGSRACAGKQRGRAWATLVRAVSPPRNAHEAARSRTRRPPSRTARRGRRRTRPRRRLRPRARRERTPRRAAQRGGLPGAIDARRQPGEVASRARQLVLRDLRAGALRADHRPFDEHYRVLFNSYYHGVGAQHPRAERGLVTRPASPRCCAIARRSTSACSRCCTRRRPTARSCRRWSTLGLHHEQQHQELLLTDIKHLLSRNPRARAYARRWPMAAVQPEALRWFAYDAGLFDVGHDPAPTAPSASTTRRRAIASGSTPSSWPRGRSATASTAPSSRTAAICGPSCGSRSAGTGCRPGGAARRCTGGADGERWHSLHPARAGRDRRSHAGRAT